MSPGELVARRERPRRREPFVRQLCWRDFYRQLLAARPEHLAGGFRPRAHRWREDAGALAAWQEGRTGYPIVDAGMRQLGARASCTTAPACSPARSCEGPRIDWRRGAAHFSTSGRRRRADNTGNWQWVAGTGTDSRPNRRLSPTRQAQRLDPDGIYAQRYLAEVGTPEYPEPIEVAA